MPLGARPVEAYVDGIDISNFLDSTFLGLLTKRLPGIRAVAISFAHEIDDKDIHGEHKIRRITIWYPERPRGAKTPSVSVDTDSPDDLTATLDAMAEFVSPAKEKK